MVDYILKIDIDESALVRKLNAALKKVQMPGVATGQSGQYAATMGGFGRTMQQGGQGAQLTELGMKRVSEAAQIQSDFRAGQRNTLLLDNDLKLFRENQKYQHTMERAAKLQNNWTAKMFNVGTVVKLAGLATGVAGLLQFRKIIIESSPMLQAMLKILNVAVMFILRPIGDFIGFVLRPLLIPFLKQAVLFYTSRLSTTIGAGDLTGNAIADMDFFTALEGFGIMIQNIFDPKGAAERLKKVTEDGVTFWDNVSNILNLLNPITAVMDKAAQAAALAAADALRGWKGLALFTAQFAYADLPADAQNTIDKIHPWEKQPTPEDGPMTFEDWKKIYEDSGMLAPKTKTTDLSEGMGIGDEITTRVTRPLDKSKYQKTEGERIMQRVEEYQRQNEKAQEVVSPYGNYAKEGFYTEGEKILQEEVSIAQDELSVLEDSLDRLDLTAEEAKVIRAKIAETNEKLSTMTDELKGVNNTNAAGFARVEEAIRLAAIATNPIGFTGGGGGGSTDTGGRSPAQNFSLGRKGFYEKDGKRYGADGEELGCGGLIDEEIWGVGRDTGKFYKMGEKGDEMVIPWSSARSSLENLQRIGFNPNIGEAQTTRSVGKFTGISAGRYGRYLANLQESQQRQGDYQSQMDKIGTRPSKTKTQTYSYSPLGGPAGMTRQRNVVNPEYKKWLEAGGSSIEKNLSQANEDVGRWSSAASPYEGSNTAESLMGSKTTDITNQNSITINVANAQNADDLIAQLGDKLLKFLQDNDARVGIR